MSRDSRSPTMEATPVQDQTSSATEAMASSPPSQAADSNRTPTPKILADRKHDIEVLLDANTRKDFHNAVNGLMWIGGRKIKAVEPRRQKIREIVLSNNQIAGAYAVLATTQRASEKRVTFQLPLVEMREDQEEGQAEMREHESVGEQAMRPIIPRRDPTAPRGRSIILWEARRPSEPVAADFHRESPVIRKPQQQRQKPRNWKPMEHEDADIVPARIGSKDVDMTDPADMASRAAWRQSHTQTPTTKPPVQRNASGKQVAKLSKQSPWSGPATEKHSVTVSVTNPEAFPIERVQVVQSQHYPFARIISMQTHRDIQGSVGQVTADMQDGPVNRLLIKDLRIVQALGLLRGANDTIAIRTFDFKIDETFIIAFSSQQRPKNLANFVVGELVPARHAFLYWLDHRGTADPKHPPFALEVRHIAMKLGRRALDVWKEIDGYWQLEQGSGGSMYRRNRLENLGEDPVHIEMEDGKKSTLMSMWG